MKLALFVAAAIIVDIPDDILLVDIPPADNPLDELSARLRREAAFGRDSVEPLFTPVETAAWTATICRKFAMQR
jgi:hypothetical protein